jgi:putative pyruvate formate lyase activating enzyme
MPAHVACCTVPVLEWIGAEMPATPVNVMDQYHPDNWCDPAGPGYRPQYAAIARRTHRSEIRSAHAHADRLGLVWHTITHERSVLERLGLVPGI